MSSRITFGRVKRGRGPHLPGWRPCGRSLPPARRPECRRPLLRDPFGRGLPRARSRSSARTHPRGRTTSRRHPSPMAVMFAGFDMDCRREAPRGCHREYWASRYAAGLPCRARCAVSSLRAGIPLASARMRSLRATLAGRLAAVVSERSDPDDNLIARDAHGLAAHRPAHRRSGPDACKQNRNRGPCVGRGNVYPVMLAHCDTRAHCTNPAGPPVAALPAAWPRAV